MNTNEIAVTADGYVHVGQNCWASLDDIQRAVEQKTSPALTNNEGSEGQMEHRVKSESPTLNIVPPKSEQWSEQRVLNLLQEGLPLPSTMIRNNEVKSDTVSDLHDDQHLTLPSTFRKVEDHRKQAQPTVNRDCPQCEEHLIPLSTMRKRAAS